MSSSRKSAGRPVVASPTSATAVSGPQGAPISGRAAGSFAEQRRGFSIPLACQPAVRELQALVDRAQHTAHLASLARKLLPDDDTDTDVCKAVLVALEAYACRALADAADALEVAEDAAEAIWHAAEAAAALVPGVQSV